MDTLEVLAECLAATPAARVHWTQAYTSNLGPSGQLLSYLGNKRLSVKTDEKKSTNPLLYGLNRGCGAVFCGHIIHLDTATTDCSLTILSFRLQGLVSQCSPSSDLSAHLSHTFPLQTPTGSGTGRILTSQSCRRLLRLSRFSSFNRR